MVLSLTHMISLMPTLVAGIVLLALMRRLVRSKMVGQPVPVTVQLDEE